MKSIQRGTSIITLHCHNHSSTATRKSSKVGLDVYAKGLDFVKIDKTDFSASCFNF